MGTEALKGEYINSTIVKPEIYTTRTSPKIKNKPRNPNKATHIYLKNPRETKLQKKAKIDTKTKANTYSQTQNPKSRTY